MKFAAGSGGIVGLGAGMVIASLVVLAGIDPLSTTGSRAAYAAGDVFALPIEVTWAVMGAGVIVLGAAGLADLYKSDVQ